MEPRSISPSAFRCRATRPPIHRRVSWPARKGTRSRATTASSESAETPEPAPPSSSAVRSGVRTTPTSVEKVPAQMAAGTLPRAMEVKVIEDWTVDGTTHRKSSPV